MLMDNYNTEFVDPFAQTATQPSWWQSLIGLGVDTLHRVLPLPGEQQGGIPGVPRTNSLTYTPTPSQFPTWGWALIAVGAFLILPGLMKGR
jgi:hypothetical protein